MPVRFRASLATWRCFMGGILPGIGAFPVLFEDKVAREMGEYLPRYDAAKDLVLWGGDRERVTRSITIDGSDPALASGQAHLRWFILHDSLARQ